MSYHQDPKGNETNKPSHSPEESLAESAQSDHYIHVNLDILAVVTGPVPRYYTIQNSDDDEHGMTGYYTAIFKVYTKGRPGDYVEVAYESDDGPALLKLCDEIIEAGGLQAFGQLYLDRDNIEGEGLRCDHKMEAKLVSPFPVDGVDGKPANDPEVLRLLFGLGYRVPEDVM